MKIRGESGGVPARMGGGAGAVSRGGSVKIKPGTKAGSMADAQRKSANQAATNTAAERKSGALAKTTGSRVMTGKPKGTIKINSAPAKSADAAKKAADAKALKAANKKKK